MHRCILCRFEIEEDDVKVGSNVNARAVCVRCFAREVGDEHPMPKGLRRMIEAALSAAEGA